MPGESDGIEEAFEAQLRTLLMAASRIAERISRAREQALRDAQARSEHEARELSSRLAAERAAANAQLRAVYQDGWWDSATPAQVADTYQLARAWASTDPDAAEAEQHMGEELRGRYGVDVAGLENDPAAVQEALDARAQSLDAQTSAQAETAEAVGMLAAADAIDQQAETEAAVDGQRASAQESATTAEADHGRVDVEYDSAERREQFAQQLIAAGVEPEHARGRVLADVGRSESASSSVGQSRPSTPRASKGRARSGAAVQRTGPER